MNGDLRIAWIDVLKGIGIFFVIFGHLSIPEPIRKYIFSFHIPLFFFISGLLYSTINYSKFVDILKRKFRTLIIPYINFSIITYIFWLLVSRKFGDDALNPVNIFKPLVGIVYSNGINHWLEHNPSLWFITCLFSTEILFFFILRLSKKIHITAIILVVSSIIGYLDSIFMPFRLPWGIDVAFTAIVFFGTGYLLKLNINGITGIIKSTSTINKTFIFVILTTINVFTCFLNNAQIDMNWNRYNNYFYFYISSFTGIFSYIFIANFLKNIKPISYIGKNSLVFFSLHLMALTFVKGFLVFILKVPLELFNRNSIVIALVLTLLCILLLVPVINLLNRYTPFLIGAGIKNHKTNRLHKR